MTICYFTATGNCLYVARCIGGTLISIPQLMKEDQIKISDEAVGVVCPCYAGEMQNQMDTLPGKNVEGQLERVCRDIRERVSRPVAITPAVKAKMAMYKKMLADRILKKDTANIIS